MTVFRVVTLFKHKSVLIATLTNHLFKAYGNQHDEIGKFCRRHDVDNRTEEKN